ncbi:phospholipase D [Aspergillus clavatus NRRL 1]|uniref:Phospholipase D1 n=1 Tax=Aspergillus clavatus (strain ATCC 1007 / CBS 513.65 / DSM 816 / NCTC 3887 / NRRL 1 / QM 1276 / 107) TaxID=344612 RepID=A1CJ37_ASPCL|nr:phospholipase D1 (PLD1), putative [Aspergillus clavatus NRRL 1]EAW09161.1 phospholipase D1 (PLD1), putative [Aspergillus clavatus NRRL 1]
MTDSAPTPSPLRDLSNTSDQPSSTRPDPVTVSSGTPLASPFPSPTRHKHPELDGQEDKAKVVKGRGPLDDSQLLQENASQPRDSEGKSRLQYVSGAGEGSDNGLWDQSVSPGLRRPNGLVDSQRPSLEHNQQQPSTPGAATPSRRPSVQFTRDASDVDPSAEASRSRAPSVIDDETDAGLKGKQSIFTKLKALASPSFTSHSRSASGATLSELRHTNTDLATPGSERGGFRFPDTLEEEGSDADADAEESAGEQRAPPRRKKKFTRRQQEPDSAPQTEPNTPRTARRPSFHLTASFAPFENYRANFFPRRVSTGDFSQQREGVSEDEGRDRLNRDAWRRRSAWLNARGLSYSGRQQETQPGQDERRPSNFRRLTGLAGPSDNPDGTAPPWRRHRADRGSSLSAQKWRQIKAGLKLIGQRRKAENTVDYAKSAELLAELTSGVPAALILASMFQRDEHGSKRIPILLEQLKVRVTDSKIDANSGDRHLVFRIELEYGSGMTRMKWIIHRTLRDFANLHLKYKLHFGTQKYIQLRTTEGAQNLPRFPRSAFPYLRGVRGLESDMEDEEDEGGYETAAEATSGNERAGRRRHPHGQRRLSGGISRRQSSITNTEGETTAGPAEAGPATKREPYPERQRKKLEAYLQKMIRFLIFKADSNRLCKFLELSALGVRLAAEGSYHGKEGYLIIQSSKGLDFRRALTPAMVKKRHSPKWFLVRHSYLVCVDSPEEMHIYDVFLVDPFFKLQTQKISLRNQKAKDLAKSATESARHPQHHTLRLENSERKLRLLARNERQLHQFEDSLRFMVTNTPWAKPNRFDSFAPVRQNCFAQWLVDARDHMWMVSRAINQAKDVIYIHDWWLSPELYLRRPAAISQKWRLDRLLQQKAREGVKIFVIMYRNINSAIPIDSEYSKFSLLDLHPNVFVQRSPNQFRQNTFFWAHHEKLCLIDHTVAFVGGIDLCFGRWDTPQHLLTDDKPTGFETPDGPKDVDHCQLWPGKDYSNPRIQDFYDLDKPYEEMYDRNVIPRMPWHDISMHVVGQPARDLTRHFVQRWNYILRQRKPTRPTPFLLPPLDFDPADLEALGLDGTCEVQILRSSSMWSTGTPDVTEHSIMNAYVKMIEESEHFVYIENQFFISTCEIDGRKIENLIRDALVERIIRASKNQEAWRAVIVIPLIPGFQNTVDSEGGTSVRLIMQCQYRSICRGETSIFGRLRALGIEPEDYIQFFSLRAWGKIGPQKQLVTEQLYIHAKCMVVDDRAAIIGSANINERSMLGSRDSEVAAIVRDTDMIWSTMNGRPYLVGRFPHTLRMRLMREHLGIDVDELMEHSLATEEELRKIQIAEEDPRSPGSHDKVDSESLMLERQDERDMIERRHRVQDEFLSRSEDLHSFNHDVDWEQGNNPNLKSNRKLTADPRVTSNPEHKKDVDGLGPDHFVAALEAGIADGRDSQILDARTEVLVSSIASEGKGTIQHPKPASPQNTHLSSPSDQEKSQESPSPASRDAESAPVVEGLAAARHPAMTGHEAEGDNSGTVPPSSDQNDPAKYPHPLIPDLKHIFIDKDCMRDPVIDIFYLDTWHAVAEKNTKIYRTVFRCMPDSEVKSWKEYKEYASYGERFSEMQSQNSVKISHPSQQKPTGPPGTTTTAGTGINRLVPHSGSNSETHTHHKGAQGSDEKSEPRAAEAGRDGADRGQADLAKQETLSSIDEKTALKVGDTAGQGGTPNGRSEESGPIKEAVEPQPTEPQAVDYSEALNRNATNLNRRRRRRATTISKREFHASDDVMDKQQAEELLNKIQGHLILWPYDWLEKEEQGGNWLYTLDQISPLEI